MCMVLTTLPKQPSPAFLSLPGLTCVYHLPNAFWILWSLNVYQQAEIQHILGKTLRVSTTKLVQKDTNHIFRQRNNGPATFRFNRAVIYQRQHYTNLSCKTYRKLTKHLKIYLNTKKISLSSSTSPGSLSSLKQDYPIEFSVMMEIFSVISGQYDSC